MVVCQKNCRWIVGVFLWNLLLIHYGNCRELRPNILLIVVDDVGWGDLASYGHPTQEWNAIDEMAQEGLRFTQFYSPATFCTPSRAAILTGKLPVRLGMRGDLPVFLPSHSTGLPKEELTIAELLKTHDYNTGFIGKWHLGINEFNSLDGRHLPHHHGFDYVGTIMPFSLETVCDETGHHRDQPHVGRCFLYKNTTLVQQPINLSQLTSTLVDDVHDFLSRHKSHQQEGARRPFFLTLSLAQTHTPMFNEHRFKGSSIRGVYGDQVAEMAWAVQETRTILRYLSMDQDTVVFFVSDHGPHKEMCSEGGDTGPLRGGKGNFLEGGVRVPAFAWWPGTISPRPPTAALTSHMDLFATFADFAGIELTKQLNLDGESLRQVLLDERAQSPRTAVFFYCGLNLTAVRFSRYKVYFYDQATLPQPPQHCVNGIGGDFFLDFRCDHHRALTRPLVFNVESDPGENFPLKTEDLEELLQQITDLIQQHQLHLKIPSERLFDRVYQSNSLVPCCNPPYCTCNYR